MLQDLQDPVAARRELGAGFRRGPLGPQAPTFEINVENIFLAVVSGQVFVDLFVVLCF